MYEDGRVVRRIREAEHTNSGSQDPGSCSIEVARVLQQKGNDLPRVTRGQNQNKNSNHSPKFRICYELNCVHPKFTCQNLTPSTPEYGFIWR